MRVNEQQFNKQPAYVRAYIKQLRRENEQLTKGLREMIEKSPETNVWHRGRDLDEEYNIYVPTNRVTISSQDRTVGITVTSEPKCVFLSWFGSREWDMKECAFVPSAYQQARLVSKGNMR